MVVSGSSICFWILILIQIRLNVRGLSFMMDTYLAQAITILQNSVSNMKLQRPSFCTISRRKRHLAYISSLAQTPYPYYVSVVNIKSAEVVAHGAFPEDTVGNRVTNSRQGLSDLEQGDTFWLYIQNKNPMTG